jgi:hypothetical protein
MEMDAKKIASGGKWGYTGSQPGDKMEIPLHSAFVLVDITKSLGRSIRQALTANHLARLALTSNCDCSLTTRYAFAITRDFI